jgi:hypothetical protein
MSNKLQKLQLLQLKLKAHLVKFYIQVFTFKRTTTLFNIVSFILLGTLLTILCFLIVLSLRGKINNFTTSLVFFGIIIICIGLPLQAFLLGSLEELPQSAQRFLLKCHTLLRQTTVSAISFWNDNDIPDLSKLTTFPIIGFRIWEIKNDILVSPNMQTPWLPLDKDYLSYIATCELSGHKTPQGRTKSKSLSKMRSCHCGFYAYYSLAHLLSDYRLQGDEQIVIGIIAGFGQVAFHKKGFRTEKCKIIGLVDPFELAAEIYSPQNAIFRSRLSDFCNEQWSERDLLSSKIIPVLLRSLDSIDVISKIYNLPISPHYHLEKALIEHGDFVRPLLPLSPLANKEQSETTSWIHRVKV